MASCRGHRNVTVNRHVITLGLTSTPVPPRSLLSAMCFWVKGSHPIVLSLEAIMLALRLVALALGAFRPFSQVFDLTSGPIVQGWVA